MRIQIDPKSLLRGLNNREDFDPAYISQLATDYQKPDHTIPDPVVRKCPDGTIQLVAGECRTRGAIEAGLDLYWVDLRDDMTDDQALLVMFKENENRRNTNYIEKAKFYQRYAVQILKQQPDKLNASAIADKVGQSADLVRRRLLLLDLNEQYQQLLIKNILTVTLAESLARLDKNRQQLCYQKWAKLTDSDRTPQRLEALSQHYKAQQDSEIAAQLQGDMFADMNLFSGVPMSWDDLRDNMAIKEIDKKTTSQELNEVKAALALAETALANERANTARAKAKVIAKFKAEREVTIKLLAELKRWKSQVVVPVGATHTL